MKSFLKPGMRPRTARPHPLGSTGVWWNSWRGYLAAIGLVLVVFLLKSLLVSILGPESPFIFFPLSVLLAAWYFGLGPGLLVAAISTLTVIYFYILPISSLGITNQYVQEVFVYAIEALAFCWLVSAVRQREIRLASSHEQLQADLSERKRILESLYESEQRFRELADAMPQLVWTARPDGTVDYYNARYRQYLGIHQSNNNSWEWAPVLHEDDVAATVEAWENAVKNGTPYEIAHRVHCSDGTFRWHLSRGIPVRDESGRIVRWYGTATDIDAEKKIELALRASEELFAKAFHHSPEPMVITRLDSGKYIDVNESFARLIGIKREDIIGRTTYEVGFWVEGNPSREPVIQRLVENGRLEQVELPIRNVLGEVKTILCSAEMIDLGNEPHILVQIVDITERKRAEKALRASEAHLKRSQEIAHLGSWQLDLVENRLTWSDEVYKIFGLEPQAFAATYEAFLEYVHPEDREAVDTAYVGSIKEGRDTYEIEHRIVRPSTGEVRYVHEKCEHVRNEKGEIISSYGMVHDITERRQSEKLLQEQAEKLQAQAVELHRLNESLDERVRERTAQVRHLASELTLSEQRERHRIAHILHDDLQQLLYALHLRLSVISKDPVVAGQNSLFSEQLGRMRSLVDQAIATTRRLTVDLSPPVLDGDGFEQAIQWLALQMKQVHSLDVELQSNGECRIARKDLRVFLFQIVRELLFNVVKHAGTGHARVNLIEENDELVITVEDDGPGFDVKETLQQQRLEGGFGLANAHERLKLFDGSLEVVSAPGRGTHMTIRMPLQNQSVNVVNSEQ